jgi:hypothetical protein
MASTIDGDDKIVEFPKTAEERRAFRKAKLDMERRRISNRFIDTTGLFRTPAGVGYADLNVAEVRQTWPVKSREFRFAYVRYLRGKYEAMLDMDTIQALAMGLALNKSVINEAIDTFEMQAITSPIVRDVHARVAGHGDDIFIDLGDDGWHAVRITAMGWSVVQSPPVRFRRTNGMQPLPFPQCGTSIDMLRPLLNVSNNDFVLVVAFLLAALQPRSPYPVLVLIGEQGSAKTSFMRILRSLVDPSVVPSSPLPLSSRDFFIAAANSHIQAFENVSRLSDTMSDHLCRLATGGGLRLRRLYTDIDETLLRTARPIMLEGIANFVTRADLMDRALILNLEQPSTRKTERALQADFEKLRPGLFGALLDLMAVGIRQLPHTHLVNPPRMADFCSLGVACGLDGFEAAYAANRQAAINVALEHDALACAVRALVAQQRMWEGTATELLDIIEPMIKVANAKVLADELRRLAPMLRTVGVELLHRRTNTRRGITIRQL